MNTKEAFRCIGVVIFRLYIENKNTDDNFYYNGSIELKQCIFHIVVMVSAGIRWYEEASRPIKTVSIKPSTSIKSLKRSCEVFFASSSREGQQGARERNPSAG